MMSGRNATVLVLVSVFGLFAALIETTEATCGGDIIMERGILESPNYPEPYEPQTNCIWRITVPEGYKVALKFLTLRLEPHETCDYDYVEIHDGYENPSHFLGRFCGPLNPEDILSSGNIMTVKFRSDTSNQLEGFEAYFKKVNPNKWTPAGEHLQVDVVDDDVYAGVDASLNNLTQFYLDMRQSEHFINKWGHNLPRIATALYLANPGFFHPLNQTGQEIAYEISLQLLSKLYMKNKMCTNELSLYVNSLLVSCIDPRDFFGINVMAELRKRVDSSNYTNPFTILTLCNAGDDMTMDDVSKVLSAFDMQCRRLWTDNQALATIALSCLSTRPHLTVDDADLNRMIVALKSKQHKNGTVDNLATTALVMQALMATDRYLDDSNIKEAMKFITQKIGKESLSIIDSFYVLPILSKKSLLNISNHHCKAPFKADMDLLVDHSSEQDERIQVQYSVFVGDKMDFIRTWKIKVPANFTFYNVLETIASLEPEYRVRYSVIDGKPYVSGLMKMVDHAEREMYWFIYKQTLGSSDEPKLIESSPVDIQVNQDEEFILWYRSGSWISK